MRRFVALLLVCLLTSLIRAQDVPVSHLLTLLSFVPDTEDGRAGTLEYTAFHQAAASYLAAQKIDQTAISMLYSKVELEADRNRLLANDFVQMILTADPDMLSVTGIVGRDIAAALVYGQPPARGVVIAGEFDTAAVTDAHAARGYGVLADEATGFTLLCAELPCANGYDVNLKNRNPANIFDYPALGRQPNVALSSSIISSAYFNPMLTAGLEGHAFETLTLAQQPDYAGLAHALNSVERDLLQAYILPPAIFATFPVITANTSEEFFDGIALGHGDGTLGDELKNYGALPPFNLAAVADYQTATSQSAVIAVVYPDAELAQQAAEELDKRFSTFRDELVAGQREATLTEEFAGSYEVKIYHDAEMNVSVVMIVLDYPLPELNNDGTVPVMGSLYQRLTRSIIQQAFYLLWQVELPDWFTEKYPAD